MRPTPIRILSSARIAIMALACVFLSGVFLSAPEPAHARSIPEAIDQLASGLARQIGQQQVRRITILQFTNLSGGQSVREQEMADRLIAAVHRAGNFEVVDRLRAERVARQLALPIGAQVVGETAARIGRGVGADAVVTATIEDHGGGTFELQAQAFSTQRGINIASSRSRADGLASAAQAAPVPTPAPSRPTPPAISPPSPPPERAAPPSAPDRLSTTEPSGALRFTLRSVSRGSGGVTVFEIDAANTGPRVEIGIGSETFALDEDGAHLRLRSIRLAGVNAAAGYRGVSRLRAIAPTGATVSLMVVLQPAGQASARLQLFELDLGEFGVHTFRNVPIPHPGP